MVQQNEMLAKRIREIEEEILALQKESAMLSTLSSYFVRSGHLLRENDKFTARSAAKYQLLARVAEFLNDPHQALDGGAGTRRIYDGIFNRSEAEKFGTQRPVSKDSDTNIAMNYNTFRSYLARFGAEGRIYFDEKKRRGRMTEKDLSFVPEELTDEDERDYS